MPCLASAHALLGAALLAAGAGCGAVPTNATDRAEPIVVAELVLIGVHSVDEQRLREALQTRQPSRLPWRSPAVFDRQAFEEDLRRIEEFYAAHGYPHARVVDIAEQLDDERNAMSLRVVVEEGAPVRLAALEYQGFDVLPPAVREALRQQAPIQPGEPLVRTEVDQTAQTALRALANAGFAFARVDLEEVPEAHDEVRLVLRATPGARAVFGSIDIVGNIRVDDEVIRRELAYLPGQPFELRALQESQLRVYLLGLFDEVTIDIVDPEGPPGPVRTRVSVVEGDQRDFELSVGYGTEQQLHVDGHVRHRNFLGGARIAGVRGRWSWLDRGVQGQFVQPHLFSHRLSLHTQGHAWFTDERWYDLLTRGGRAAVEYRPGARLSTRVGVTSDFTSSRLADAPLGDPALDVVVSATVNPLTGQQRGLLSAIVVDTIWDATGGALEPQRGYLASLQVEQAGGWLPGSFNYTAVVGEGRIYGSRGALTLAQRVRYGAIAPLNGPADVPFFRRYFLGGADSLRGWGRLEVGPLSAAGLPIGGHAMFEASTELRVPLLDRVRGVVFLDAGNVWTDAWEFHPGDLLYAAGAGVRYASPFGPVRVDIGYQLTPRPDLRIDGEPQTRRWRVHFGVVQPF